MIRVCCFASRTKNISRHVYPLGKNVVTWNCLAHYLIMNYANGIQYQISDSICSYNLYWDDRIIDFFLKWYLLNISQRNFIDSIRLQWECLNPCQMELELQLLFPVWHFHFYSFFFQPHSWLSSDAWEEMTVHALGCKLWEVKLKGLAKFPKQWCMLMLCM